MEYIMLMIKLSIGFAVLMVMIRVVGKKEMASASPLDVVYAVLLGDLIGNGIYDPQVKVLQIVVAIVFWTLLIYGIDFIGRKFKGIGKAVEGKMEVLIYDGSVDKKVMAKNRLSMEEVKSLLRQNGVFNLHEVKMAILEPNGNLSILKKQTS